MSKSSYTRENSTSDSEASLPITPKEPQDPKVAYINPITCEITTSVEEGQTVFPSIAVVEHPDEQLAFLLLITAFFIPFSGFVNACLHLRSTSSRVRKYAKVSLLVALLQSFFAFMYAIVATANSTHEIVE